MSKILQSLMKYSVINTKIKIKSSWTIVPCFRFLGSLDMWTASLRVGKWKHCLRISASKVWTEHRRAKLLDSPRLYFPQCKPPETRVLHGNFYYSDPPLLYGQEQRNTLCSILKEIFIRPNTKHLRSTAVVAWILWAG